MPAVPARRAARLPWRPVRWLARGAEPSANGADGPGLPSTSGPQRAPGGAAGTGEDTSTWPGRGQLLESHGAGRRLADHHERVLPVAGQRGDERTRCDADRHPQRHPLGAVRPLDGAEGLLHRSRGAHRALRVTVAGEGDGGGVAAEVQHVTAGIDRRSEDGRERGVEDRAHLLRPVSAEGGETLGEAGEPAQVGAEERSLDGEGVAAGGHPARESGDVGGEPQALGQRERMPPVGARVGPSPQSTSP